MIVPEPPDNLTYSLDSDNARVLLSWDYNTLSDFNNKRYAEYRSAAEKPEIKGLELFRARLMLSDDACRGCPLDFARISSIAFPISEYREPIEKGFVYFYKARYYTDHNILSQFSETVEVEFQ
ncbi:MAG: hypothetical protein HQK61_02425 [Desulfamplus sp.]|nr:hypothetical protein [Desulfamplus sp.]